MEHTCLGSGGNRLEHGRRGEGRGGSFEDSVHVASLRALMELGQTAMDLEEFDSATSVFERRLRYNKRSSCANVVHLDFGVYYTPSHDV